MLANDIKKDMRVRRKCGDEVVVKDNKKGMIRCIEAFSPFHEIGDEYVYKWSQVLNPATGEWEKVEMTDAQKKQALKIRTAMNALGGY